MHKNTKMLPYQRREAYRRWIDGDSVIDLAKRYSVSRRTIYSILHKAKLGVFVNYSSKNLRFRTVEYGFKRLAKVEKVLAKKIERREHRLRRYVKDHPGELVHFDTKKLPRLAGEAITQPREWLHVAVDDASRFLFADILPDKTGWSSAIHLDETLMMMPFVIECAYSDNGSEYRGRKDHPFVALLTEKNIGQKFTRPRTPRTNGKAERVIKTLMMEWHKRRQWLSRDERRKFLYAYVRWYNQVRPHQSLGDKSPIQFLEEYVRRQKLQQSGYNAC